MCVKSDSKSPGSRGKQSSRHKADQQVAHLGCEFSAGCDFAWVTHLSQKFCAGKDFLVGLHMQLLNALQQAYPWIDWPVTKM